jgi:hypothetical protein
MTLGNYVRQTETNSGRISAKERYSAVVYLLVVFTTSEAETNSESECQGASEERYKLRFL